MMSTVGKDQSPWASTGRKAANLRTELSTAPLLMPGGTNQRTEVMPRPCTDSYAFMFWF